MKEKQYQAENDKVQEKAIAQYYTTEADKYRMELEEEKQKKKKAKEDYYKALSTQISQNNKKKQYSVLMSEHERRVNDRDIKAYEYQDTENLYAKVPGFGGDNKLEKYIDKSMHIEKTNQMSPGKHLSSNQLDTSSEHGSHLAKAGKMSLNHSTNILTDGKEPPRNLNGEPYPMTKLQRVRENMEKEDAIKFRANTVNRSYGFDQRSKQVAPPNKVFNRRDQANPFEYNFVAPGNY